MATPPRRGVEPIATARGERHPFDRAALDAALAPPFAVEARVALRGSLRELRLLRRRGEP